MTTIRNIIRFVFWNVHHSDSNIQRIIQYGLSDDIDVIALCEAPDKMRLPDHCPYYLVEHIDNRIGQVDIQVLVKSPLALPKYYYNEDSRFCILLIEKYKINFVVLHLTSSLMPTGVEARNADIVRVLGAIERLETRLDNKRTLIVGDFNLGPFDAPMLDFSGFNSQIFRNQIKQKHPTRTIHGEKRDIYYNPMLRVYHDNKSEEIPRGTYYYEQKPPQWHCFDQILMKHPLVKCFNPGSLHIIERIGTESLLYNNKPIKQISDHLPIRFELCCKGGTAYVQ